MAGKPFHSILEPFYEDIVRDRRAGMTWEEIAEKIRKKIKPKTCTRQAVQYYFNRRRKKNIRIPQGMEPAAPDQPCTQPKPPHTAAPASKAPLRSASTSEKEESISEKKRREDEEAKQQQRKPKSFDDQIIH